MTLKDELREREKELDCLYHLAGLFAGYSGDEETLLRTVSTELRQAMNRPDKCEIRLVTDSSGSGEQRGPDRDFRSDFKLDDRESLFMEMNFTGSGGILLAREKNLLETVLKFTGEGLLKLRGTNLIKNKNLALGELIENLQDSGRKRSDTLSSRLYSTVFPLLRDIQAAADTEQKMKFNLLFSSLKALTDTQEDRFPALVARLSPREAEICGLIRSGASSKMIAGTLAISTETVERHRCTIRRKLGINRRGINLRSYLMNL